MEREKLISTLRERSGQNDFSEQTLGGIIDMTPLAEGAEPDEAYWERTTNFVRVLQGQYNHDFSRKFQTEVDKKVEDFKRTYKPETDPDPKPTPEPNKEVEELKKQFAEMQSRLAGYEDRQAQERLKADVLGKLETKCENGDVLELVMQTYGELDVKKDADVIAKEVETKYNALIKKLYKDGYQPNGGGGGTKPLTNAQAKAAQEDFRKQLIKSGRIPKPTVQ